MARPISAAADAISLSAVRAALAVARHPHSKGRGRATPLQQLACVGARLAAMNLRDDDTNRFRALTGLLGELIWQQITAQRGNTGGHPSTYVNPAASAPSSRLALPSRPPTSAGQADTLRDLAEDFRSGSHARERWGALYARYIAPDEQPVESLAKAAGVGRVTFARRLNEGLGLLVEVLFQLEQVATAGHPEEPDSTHASQSPPPRSADVSTSPTTAMHADNPDEDPPSASEAFGRPPLPEYVRAKTVSARRRPPLAPRTTPEGGSSGSVEQESASLTSYRVARIAEWSAPRYALDKVFVQLTMLVDRGQGTGERWEARDQTYDDLGSAIGAAGSPAVVILGPPGSGKSTLLRNHELQLASAGLRGETNVVTFMVPLSQYRGDHDSGPPSPAAWLAARWQRRFPQHPAFERLLGRGQMCLLLDGLNEMPHRTSADYYERVTLWRQFLGDAIFPGGGNQAVISCRNLDYSAPLSSAQLAVPHLRIEPLDDDQVRLIWSRYAGPVEDDVWQQLVSSPLFELLRLPMTLRLVAEAAAPTGQLPPSRAALFTLVVRRALRRELEQGAAHLAPGALLTVEDLRQLTQDAWRGPADLPERGRLFTMLAELATEMQRRTASPGGAGVRVGREQVVRLFGPLAEPLVHVAAAIDLVDEDVAADEVFFRHQAWQEYFAARQLAQEPDAGCAIQPWRAADLERRAAELLAELPAGEPLPALPASGWEESTLLAVSMSRSPEAYVAELIETNLPLAASAAAQPDVRRHLSNALIDRLRLALVARSADPEADLRARIAAAIALGPFGDPRFEVVAGPNGTALVPPMITVAAGRYPIGRDEPFEVLGRQWSARYAAQHVALTAFQLSRFHVTNAEWAAFMAAGGYEDGRWWTTLTAAAWRRGEGTTRGIHESVRDWTARYRAEPDLLEATYRSGSYGEDFYRRWLARMAMTPAELEAHLDETYPSMLRREPAFWRDGRFNQPLQPVVGICWFEASAYVNWLRAQTGRPFRLARDVELEAAARGLEGRQYPYGEAFLALGGNTVAAHLRQTSPIGVFVEGYTPEGLADMSGNAESWTMTLERLKDDQHALFIHDPQLDDPNTPDTARRVLRGGSWRDNHTRAHPAYGVSEAPDNCPDTSGLRLACDG